MPPTLILIRHGEALHNVNKDYSLPDPVLSQLGERQCAALHQHLRHELPLAEQVEVIVSSPMIRTLQTTSIGLDWLVQKGVPVELDAMWQENSSKPCDTGTPLPRLQPLYPSFDFAPVDPVYPSKGPSTPYAFTKTAVLARGESCLKALYRRTEKVVAVVSHSGFLRCAVSHAKYANADYRIFDFIEGTDPEKPEIREWALTEERGGGMGTSERGSIGPEAADFPPESVEMEEVGEDMGEKRDGEATGEVPN